MHVSAVVHPSVELGYKAYIGPFCVVEKDAKIGDGTKLHSHVVVGENTCIGKNNSIYPFTTIGNDPQDLKYKGQSTIVIIGDNNTIREGVSIHCATGVTIDRTIIGDNNLLMANVHIAHDCVVGCGNIMANNVALAGHCQVYNYTVLGGYSLFQQHIKVGSYCFTGMSSVVRSNIPPFTKAAGHPAKLFGINFVGLKRNNFDESLIEVIEQAVKRLLVPGNMADKCSHPEIKEMAEKHPQVQYIVDFIRQSKNGTILYPSYSKT